MQTNELIELIDRTLVDIWENIIQADYNNEWLLQEDPLKCAASTGYLDTQYAEEFLASEEVKMDFLTQSGDIIVRLSTPYTAIMITKEEWCGYLERVHIKH